MKKTALLAAAAAMFTATPALAVGGYVGVESTTSEVTTLSLIETDALEGEFAVGFGSGSWGAQVDGSFGNTEFQNGFDIDTNTLAGHVWYDGGNWRLGGVIARSDLDVLDEEWVYGIEGTFDAGDKTVLSASALSGEHEAADFDTLSYDFGANFYVTPNLRVGGGIGFIEVESGGSDSQIDTLSLSGEYQPFAAPVSLTLNWGRLDLDGPGGSESLSVGVRWNFGADRLRDRDNLTPFSAASGLLARIYGVSN